MCVCVHLGVQPDNAHQPCVCVCFWGGLHMQQKAADLWQQVGGGVAGGVVSLCETDGHQQHLSAAGDVWFVLLLLGVWASRVLLCDVLYCAGRVMCAGWFPVPAVV